MGIKKTKDYHREHRGIKCGIQKHRKHREKRFIV